MTIYFNFVKNSSTLFSEVEFEMIGDSFHLKKVYPLHTSNKNVLSQLYLHICAYAYILCVTETIREKGTICLWEWLKQRVPGDGQKGRRNSLEEGRRSDVILLQLKTKEITILKNRKMQPNPFRIKPIFNFLYPLHLLTFLALLYTSR